MLLVKSFPSRCSLHGQCCVLLVLGCQDRNFDRNRPDVDRTTDPVELRTPKDAQEHNKKLLTKLGIQTSGLKQMSDRWRHTVQTLTTGCANYESRVRRPDCPLPPCIVLTNQKASQPAFHLFLILSSCTILCGTVF